MKLITSILDIIFPILCINCGNHGEYICKKCVKNVSRNRFQECFHCGRYCDFGALCSRCKPLWDLDGIIVVCESSELLRYAIHKYKYNFIVGLSAFLADKFCFCFSYEIGTNNEWSLVPVPLHKKREKWRGFNQSMVIAKLVKDSLLCDLDTKLQRINYSKPQMELDKITRIENIKDAFVYKEQRQKHHRKALIIDDVITTGSTLNECARVLKRAGYTTVWGIALSRGTT